MLGVGLQKTSAKVWTREKFMCVREVNLPVQAAGLMMVGYTLHRTGPDPQMHVV